MAGLVPAIHAVTQTATLEELQPNSCKQFVGGLQTRRSVTAWMAGTSPAMTASARVSTISAIDRSCVSANGEKPRHDGSSRQANLEQAMIGSDQRDLL